MLGYSFLRERIINNNSLSTFEYDDEFGFNLDTKYIDLSMENERMITDIKISYPSIVSSMVDLTKLSDSELFCSSIIGTAEYPSVRDDTSDTSETVNLKSKPYQTQVDTIVQA